MDRLSTLPFKESIEVWHKGVMDFDDGNFQSAQENFDQIIGVCARMSFNIGLMHYRTSQFSKAILNFLMSTQKDPHMGLSHFALGLTYAHEKQHNKARQHYEKALSCLRGNDKIDYTQLGLKFSLCECDIIYNSALNLATMTTEHEWALEILRGSLKKAKQEKQRARIKEAIESLMGNQLYEPVDLPNNVFRPPPAKVEGLKREDFLGDSKVISTTSIRKKSTEKPPVPKDSKNGPKITNPFRKSSTSNSPKSSSPIIPASPTGSVFKPIQDREDGEKMSLRDGLTIWHEGVVAFEGGDVDHALDEWLKIQDPSAKILYNIAIVQMRQNDYEGARKTCHGVINKDQHLAIGHFLMGDVHCRRGHFDDAWGSFDKALSLLRKKASIDYSQLGLAHRLYKCEILLNQAYCYEQSGSHEWTKHLLMEAKDCVKGPNQSLIETAIKSASDGRPFGYCGIPVDVVFKPPKSKIDNLAEQNFLGTSTVVSALKSSSRRQRDVVTPPRGPSPNPPPTRTPPPAPAQAPAKPNVYEDRPPPPTRTVSKGREGRPPSPGLPSRLPPTIPIGRSRSPNPPSVQPPSRRVIPSSSNNEYESPAVSASSTPPHGSPTGSSHGTPNGHRKGPPNKSLPPPPTRAPPTHLSVTSPVSSTPPLSPEARQEISHGPPKKPLPPPPTKTSAPSSVHGSTSSSQSSSPRSLSPNVENQRRVSGSPSPIGGRQRKLSTDPPKKPLPPSPFSKSPQSTSPRTASPVKALVDHNSSPKRRPNNSKRTSGIATGSYEARGAEELSITQGDLVKIISQDGDWTVGEVGGRQGKFPSSYIQGHSIRLNKYN